MKILDTPYYQIEDALTLVKELQINNAFNSYLGNDILISKRVGVAYSSEYASLPYLFRVKNSKWTSCAK